MPTSLEISSVTALLAAASWVWSGPALAVTLLVLRVVLPLSGHAVTHMHAGDEDAHAAIARASSSNNDDDRTSPATADRMRVAVVGAGISGIGAMKVCLQEGMDPVCFEAAGPEEGIGGFWRYKEDAVHPSVYRCCHIDTDRDLAGYADRPWDPDKTGLLISGEDIARYCEANVDEFKLRPRMRFHTTVDRVTPAAPGDSNKGWLVTSTTATTTKEEHFDAVIVATGRHGGGAYVPAIPGMDSFRGEVLHSSRYKYAEKHGLAGKRVAVVGVGNSGCDIVVDICRKVESCFLVSRSGVWLQRPGHAEDAFSEAVGETLAIETFFRLPWFFITEIWERVGVFNNQDMRKDQAVLNAAGLKPAHRLFQQHYGNMTGLHYYDDDGEARTVHSEIANEHIACRRGIERFTPDGVVFAGDGGKETPLDCVIMATGFKQHCQFVDPQVVDLRWQRRGNDVPLYQGIFPISEHGNRIAFINFIQSITFLAADLQSRLACAVFKGGRVQLPPLDEQRRYMQRLRDTMCTQHMDRQQLRVQYGGLYNYYPAIAKLIGCYPSFWKLATERPTAIWHAWFTTWNPLQYRLVGPGRLECAERQIERMHHSRFWGIDPRTGRRRAGPYNRGWRPTQVFYFFRNLLMPAILVLVAKVMGYTCSRELGDRLEDYRRYAKAHEDAPGGAATPALHDEPADIVDLGSKGTSVWREDANAALAAANKR